MGISLPRPDMSGEYHREQWSSARGFVFSIAAAAVALGARSSWWAWRIAVVGRTLPVVAGAILLWRLAQLVL